MVSNQQTTLSLAAIGSLLLLGGCGDSGNKAKRHAQEECFYRMMLMSAAGCSYTLENKLPATSTIEAHSVAPYLLRGAEWTVCPSTHAKYGDFNLAEGPKCPEHGSAFEVYSSALSDKKHPCRAHALRLIGFSSKDPWNGQRSAALIDGLIGVVKEEQGKPKADAATTLQSVTGQDFGENARAWEAWWQANRDTFRFRQY